MESANCFPHHFTFLLAMYEGINFFTASPPFILHLENILAILMGVKWYLMVLIFFLMTNNPNHLFMCLLVICISSLEKCLFKTLAHFKIVCLLLGCEIYILDSKPLSDIWFANIFSHFVVVFHFLDNAF